MRGLESTGSVKRDVVVSSANYPAFAKIFRNVLGLGEAGTMIALAMTK